MMVTKMASVNEVITVLDCHVFLETHLMNKQNLNTLNCECEKLLSMIFSETRENVRL